MAGLIETISLVVGTLFVAAIIGVPLAIWYHRKQIKKIKDNIPKDMTIKVIEEKIKQKEVQNARKEREKERERGKGEPKEGEPGNQGGSGTDIIQAEVGKQRGIQIPKTIDSGKIDDSAELHKPAAL